MGISREFRPGTAEAERAVPEVARRAREELDTSPEVDARRIAVVVRGGDMALRGWVATPEEALAAIAVAERASGAAHVFDELQIDPNLREGAQDPAPVQRAEPERDEVLVGDTDMLAGPESHITDDMDRALADGEPWQPPDVPTLPPEAEPVGHLVDEDADVLVLLPDDDAHLEMPTPVRAVDRLGRAPDDETLSEPMAPQEPGTRLGPGAIGEHATRGGSIDSVAATETGARGEDTAHADPAREATGTTAKQAGTDRGPEARDDEALREDFPSED